MLYSSSRDNAIRRSFSEVLLEGLSPEGGLFFPLEIPVVSSETMEQWRNLNYQQLAVEILCLYAEGDKLLNREDISQAVAAAAREFRVPEWTKIKNIRPGLQVLELFHGPTFSFKDYALAIMGRLMDCLLRKRKQNGGCLVATSGDTGGAAVASLRNSTNATCVVMLPKNGVSEIQQRQMTTEGSERVRAVLVNGSFDDCQQIMKKCFRDGEFKKQHGLFALNSVNFGRIACQMVYYFWALLKTKENVNVCVPTGNFGNILSAYYAKKMGLPIERLIIASNVNDILPRFLDSGVYSCKTVVHTCTPAIDIQVSSNFERLLRHISNMPVQDYFLALQSTGSFSVDAGVLAAIKAMFSGYSTTEAECISTIQRYYQDYNYVIDPHTAVALSAAEKYIGADSSLPMLVTSTAHPGKFPDCLAVGLGSRSLAEEQVPQELKALLNKPEKYDVIDPTVDALKELFGKWQTGIQN